MGIERAEARQVVDEAFLEEVVGLRSLLEQHEVEDRFVVRLVGMIRAIRRKTLRQIDPPRDTQSTPAHSGYEAKTASQAIEEFLATSPYRTEGYAYPRATDGE